MSRSITLANPVAPADRMKTSAEGGGHHITANDAACRQSQDLPKSRDADKSVSLKTLISLRSAGLNDASIAHPAAPF
jgi:hypothetical protein